MPVWPLPQGVVEVGDDLPSLLVIPSVLSAPMAALPALSYWRRLPLLHDGQGHNTIFWRQILPLLMALPLNDGYAIVDGSDLVDLQTDPEHQYGAWLPLAVLDAALSTAVPSRLRRGTWE